ERGDNLFMTSKPRLVIAGLGLLLIIGLCVYWLLTMRRLLAGTGPPLVAGVLPGVRGRLAFISQLPPSRGHHLINADGSNPTILPVAADTLHWSPDGTRLAIKSCCTGLRSSIVVINADGSGRIMLTENGGVAAWSPDSTRLVFVADGDDKRTS